MASKVSGSYSFTIGETTAPDVSKAGSFDTGTIVEHRGLIVFQATAGLLVLIVPAANKSVFLHIKAYDASGGPAQCLLTINTQLVTPHFTELFWINDDISGTPVYITAISITTSVDNVTIEYEMGSMAA